MKKRKPGKDYHMKKYLLILFCCLSFSVQGQLCFEKTFGTSSTDEYGHDVYQLADSSYVMLGLGSNLMFHKFSPSGLLTWNRIICFCAFTSYCFMEPNIGKSYYISGKGIFLKIDSIGNLIFNSQLQGINYRNFARLNHTYYGGFVTTDTINVQSVNPYAFCILRFDSMAVLLRTDTIIPDSIYNYTPLAIKELTDRNFIVLARRDSGINSDWLGYESFKIDTSGNILWRSNISRDSLRVHELTSLEDTGYMVTGTNFQDSSRLFMKRYDSNGNIINDHAYIPSHGFYRHHTIRTHDRGFMIGCDGGDGDTDLLILKTDSLGNMQWYKTFGGTNFDHIGSVQQTLDHGYIICGSKTVLPSYSNDYYLIKTDSLGIIDSTLTNNFNEIINESQFAIYPNPTTGTFILKNISSKGKSMLEIMNDIGEIVYSEMLYGKNEYVLNTDFGKGIYFVKMNGVVRKLIVE